MRVLRVLRVLSSQGVYVCVSFRLTVRGVLRLNTTRTTRRPHCPAHLPVSCKDQVQIRNGAEMSRSSIKAIDAYCKVCNWDDALKNAYPDEIERWTKKRDRYLKKLRQALTEATREEYLRGRWGYTPMGTRIAQWNEMIARAD
jgi:hypothetical protein